MTPNSERNLQWHFPWRLASALRTYGAIGARSYSLYRENLYYGPYRVHLYYGLRRENLYNYKEDLQYDLYRDRKRILAMA